MNELVYLKADEAFTDSLMVAEHFHKRHDNVLRAIDNLLETLLKNEERKMFKATTRKTDDGQYHKMYLMNRDGFTLLAMGFTGKKALEWKLKYIEAFNKMEKLLTEKSTKAWIETRKQGKITRRAETDVINDLVAYAKEQGSEHSEELFKVYSKLANKMCGIKGKERDKATTYQLNNLSIFENIILQMIRSGMAAGYDYKQIYKECKARCLQAQQVAMIGG